MRGALLSAAALIALGSGALVAQEAPESLIPKGFGQKSTPTPSPSAAPAPTPTGGNPKAGGSPTPSPTATGNGGGRGSTGSSGTGSGGSGNSGSSPSRASTPSAPDTSAIPSGSIVIPSNLPSLSELERMSTDELDELLGLKPKFDIPPGARRSADEAGVISEAEGGMPVGALANQPASLVRAALAGTDRPLVSRWGHILLRRALASRLATPQGMDGSEFTALRAQALNAIGEGVVTRALVQEIDTQDWNRRLTDAAIEAYLATGDVTGACPAVRLQGSDAREDDRQWQLYSMICQAYAGESGAANARLQRALGREEGDPIDVLLAQRYAGATGRRRQAVTIEWEGVEGLTPWRWGLASALGVDVPLELRREGGPWYTRALAVQPSQPLTRRAAAATRAGREGIMSSAAMVDLYSQIYADENIEGDWRARATALRNAYVAQSTANRMAALRGIWGVPGEEEYGRLVLTARAAARMPVHEDMANEADWLIASMLSAGLDANAMRWANVVEDGSLGWAQLALARRDGDSTVSEGDVDDFIGDDGSQDRRRSKFLVAGLAGLGRITRDDVADLSSTLEIDLSRSTRWTEAISGAADVGNPVLVTYLAGLGMQGTDWSQMTPRYLYNIVSALNRVGLEGEARMIAAEAVARG